MLSAKHYYESTKYSIFSLGLLYTCYLEIVPVAISSYLEQPAPPQATVNQFEIGILSVHLNHTLN
jgi:hypothetical protein